MASLNEVRLIGNLGRDAETKFLPNGDAVTNFSIATSRRWKDKTSQEMREATTWHNVVLWRKEKLAKWLTKGQQVFVAGALDTRSFEDKDGNKRTITEVVADQVLMLGGRQESASNTVNGRVDIGGGAWMATNDDVPF